ncbi:hypothetical protein GCM10020366_02850 [Saccharopolyspora gregorii]|uniref:Uncharacterized protein n=1 Tax=Saccharopolyspora gregorii TaxID=33914 RepID=A0ABP6RGE6_9PSEU
MRTAWALGDRPELDHLNLRRWCHMLAFRGHFLSKSKAYSTTFKQIRGDRQRFRLEAALDELGVTEDTVTVVNHWDMTSVGHHTPKNATSPKASPNDAATPANTTTPPNERTDPDAKALGTKRRRRLPRRPRRHRLPMAHPRHRTHRKTRRQTRPVPTEDVEAWYDALPEGVI